MHSFVMAGAGWLDGDDDDDYGMLSLLAVFPVLLLVVVDALMLQ
jgi:hypothetical protein